MASHSELIHPSAIIDAKAELASDVRVGPYAVIGADVQIDAGTSVGSHAVVEGKTRIGKNNKIFQFASVGADPQDKKYQAEDTELIIGDGNTIREFCTLNRGTVQAGGVTRLGDDNWIMAYVHIAHDCLIGNHTIIANSVQLAGHVEIEDWAIIGGISGIHQFVRVGAHSILGFSSRLSQDLPPFSMAAGNPVQVTGINQEGLKRRGFSEERIAMIKQMQRILYRQNKTFAQALEVMAELPETEDLERMLAFLRKAERGIVR